MRRTWAVARTMIAEAIRMKVALVLLIILVAVIPLGPFIWEGDGTLKGRVQTFLTYSTQPSAGATIRRRGSEEPDRPQSPCC